MSPNIHPVDLPVRTLDFNDEAYHYASVCNIVHHNTGRNLPPLTSVRNVISIFSRGTTHLSDDLTERGEWARAAIDAAVADDVLFRYQDQLTVATDARLTGILETEANQPSPDTELIAEINSHRQA